MNASDTHQIQTSSEAWNHFVGSLTVADYIVDSEGPTTTEAIAAEFDASGLLDSDDINERDRIARLIAEYIALNA